MCTNKLRTPHCFTSLKFQNNYTTDLKTTLQVLMDKFFPTDESSSDEDFHREVRHQCNISYEGFSNDPVFTMFEVKDAVNHLAKGKAPGHDHITSEIIRQIFSTCPQELLKVYNICLKYGVFPKEWKKALIVVIPKGINFDPTDIHNYRPISLLPLLGKVLDRLMINRINWHMEKNSILSEKQFGFRRQKSAEDALQSVVIKIKNYLSTFKYVTAISLDITGAFDNAWWPMILCKLREMGCPKNVHDLAADYFRERESDLIVGCTRIEKTIARGCPQGSVSGPTFWNILFNDFLLLNKSFELFDIAFADDSILIFPANNRKEIEVKGSSVLKKVVEWGKKYKLEFNPRKTKCVVFTPPYSKTDLYRRTPVIKMNELSIPVVKNFKYLGVQLDNKLSWIPHILMIKKKIISTFNALAVVARSTWGLNNFAMKILYDSVFTSIVTYGCNVWGEVVDKTYIKKHLYSAQRIAALRITKSYRTTSFDSLCILAGIMPIDLLIKQRMLHYNMRKGSTVQFGDNIYEEGTYETNENNSSLENPWLRSNISSEIANMVYDFHIFTDGSKTTTGVGAAFVVFNANGENIYEAMFRLDAKCSNFQAELFAVKESIRWCGQQNVNRMFLLHCDSKAAVDVIKNPESLHPLASNMRSLFRYYENLQNNIHLKWVKAHVGNPGNEYADRLAKCAILNIKTISYVDIPQSTIKREIFQYSINIWQNSWNNSNKGRLTYEFFPEVRRRLLRSKLYINSYFSQFVTGHGNFKQYLHRFHIADSPECSCGTSTESPKHILFECSRYDAQRIPMEITARLLGLNWPCPLKFMIDDNQLYEKFLNFISAVCGTM